MAQPAPHRTSAGPDQDRLASRRRTTFLAVWAAVAVAVLVAFRSILVPFVMGALLAYVFSPVCDRMTRWRFGARAMPRWVAVVTLYVGLLAVLVGTLTFSAPRIAAEVRDVVRTEVPRVRAQALEAWNTRWRAEYERYVAPLLRSESELRAERGHLRPPDEHGLRLERIEGTEGWRVSLPRDGIVVQREGEDGYRILAHSPGGDEGLRRETNGLATQLRRASAGHSADLLRAGSGVVGATVGGIFRFFICLMLSAYMLLTIDDILAFFRSLFRPEQREDFDLFVRSLDRGLSGVVRGQLMICCVNGLLSAVGFAIARLPYWPLLALLCAAFSIIPIFGAFLSTIPAVLVGLRLGLGTSVFIVLWVLGIHQIEANLLNPKIMGDAAKIHPALVVFSLLVGEHFFGLLGALLAVPAMSIVQTIFLHWRRYALQTPEEHPVEPLAPLGPAPEAGE